MATPETSLTNTMAHVEELRHVAAMDSCSWDYAQKLMRSSADEIERLDADAAAVQAELESVKQERHQLRNELTAARLALGQLTNGYKFPAECCTIAREGLAGAADEPNPQVSLGPVKVGADLHQCEECGWMKFTPVGESTPEARHRNLCACQACLQERGREAIDNALKSGEQA